jgi:chromosome segregation ATPase
MHESIALSANTGVLMATTDEILRGINDIKLMLETKSPRVVELEDEVDRLRAQWQDSEPQKLDQENRHLRRELTRLQEQLADLNRVIFGSRTGT